jgi:hypothetical protein
MKGGAIVAVSAVVAKGQGPNKMTARKIWDLPLLYSLLDVMCSVCRRGVCVQNTCIGGEGGQTNEVECWSVDLDWRPDQLSCRIEAQ